MPRPTPLPPMRPDQRKLYKRLRDNGAGRDDSLKVALAYEGPGPDRCARVCRCCGASFRVRRPSALGWFCSRTCSIRHRHNAWRATRSIPADLATMAQANTQRELAAKLGVSQALICRQLKRMEQSQ